jgi:hypothetical protein
MTLLIQKAGIEIMRRQLAEGKERASTHVSMLPHQAEILVEAYAKIAELRDHDGFSDVCFGLNGTILRLIDQVNNGRERAKDALEAHKTLFAILMNVPCWTEDALIRACDKTRILNNLRWYETVMISAAKPIVPHGFPMIGQYQVQDGDRVLLRGQATFTECGVFVAGKGDWKRAPDKVAESSAWYAECDDPYLLGAHPAEYKTLTTFVYRPGCAWVCVGPGHKPWFSTTELRQP